MRGDREVGLVWERDLGGKKKTGKEGGERAGGWLLGRVFASVRDPRSLNSRAECCRVAPDEVMRRALGDLISVRTACGRACRISLRATAVGL